MTKKEALAAVIGFEIDTNLLDKQLTDSAITGSETYSLSSKRDIDLAAADVLLYMISNYQSIKEGSLSVVFPDLDTMIEKRRALLRIWSVTDSSGVGKSVNSLKAW